MAKDKKRKDSKDSNSLGSQTDFQDHQITSAQVSTTPSPSKQTKQFDDERMEHILNESKLLMEVGLQEMKEILNSKLLEITDRLQDFTQKQKDQKIVSRKKNNRKEFFPRESVLSSMLENENENYRTIFNMVLAFLFLWGSSLAYDDYTKSGLPNFDLLTWGIFRDISPFFCGWVGLFFGTFLILPMAHVASETRSKFTLYGTHFFYILFQISAFLYSGWVVNSALPRFAMPLAIGLMAEQARMSMKVHSYYREKITWKRFEGKFTCAPISLTNFRISLFGFIDLPLPEPNYFFKEISKFSYFHFAPTLVYRDSYPRTSRMRVSAVIFGLLQMIGIVYYAFLIFREVLPRFGDSIEPYGEKLPFGDFIRLTFNCMGPAMTCMIFTHFMVLHVVQNIGAELTCFADRSFYSDWWNARTFAVYYRKWNGVVHDFIHMYIYTDLVEFCGFPKIGSLLFSFIISAIVHEYMICVAMGFFLPILGILFTGPGLIFILLTRNQTHRVWNIFMWLMLTTGNAFLMVIYIREYFARSHGFGALPPPAHLSIPSPSTSISTSTISSSSHHIFVIDPNTVSNFLNSMVSASSWEEVDWAKGSYLLYDFFVPRTYRIQYYS